MAKTTVIHCLTNDLVNEQRVHKIATLLQKNEYDVLVVGRQKKNSLALSPRLYQTRRLKLLFEKGKLFYLEFNLRLFFLLLLKKNYTIIVANDLDVLLGCRLAALFRRKKLIFDAHELYTETPELVGRPIVRTLWRTLEGILVPGIKRMMTVNDSLKHVYETRYKKQVLSVYNYPLCQTQNLMTVLPTQNPTMLYQGSVNIGRGIEQMIGAMLFLPAHYQLWIIGSGDILADIEHQVAKLKLERRVKIWGNVPFEDLPAYTCQAWLGLSIEADLGLNYRLASPNKVFDYLNSGVPVLVSPFPEMVKVVQETQAGELLHDRTPKSLAQQIQTMIETPGRLAQLRENALAARTKYCFEQQSEKILALYQS